MMSESTPIFYAIFYDVSKPRTAEHAMHKRIEKSIYNNLTDDMGIKDVELKNNAGRIARFKITETSTFYIENSIDYNLFVVCDCEEIIK